MSKRANKAEREYMGRVASLGCCLCGRSAEVHHKTGAGMALRASHYDVMPLCPEHHRTGGYGVALHAGTTAWENIRGTQENWIKWTKERLAA